MGATIATKFIIEDTKQTCAYCGGVLQLIEGSGLEVATMMMVGFYEDHAPCGELLPGDRIPLVFMKLYQVRENARKQREGRLVPSKHIGKIGAYSFL